MRVEYTANIKLKIVEEIEDEDDLIENPKEFFDNTIMEVLMDTTTGQVIIDLISHIKLSKKNE